MNFLLVSDYLISSVNDSNHEIQHYNEHKSDLQVEDDYDETNTYGSIIPSFTFQPIWESNET